MQIEYGLIALVLIQLGAVAGCLLAWFRIRTEIDRIRDNIVTETSLTATFENRITPLTLRVTEIESRLLTCEQVAKNASLEAGKASKQVIDGEEWERKLLSVQNALSAFKRHRMEKEPEPEPEPEPELMEFTPPEPMPPPPALIRGRSLVTFGKSA